MEISKRMRRLRRTSAIRNLFCETRVHIDDLIYPVFVDESLDSPVPVKLMPGVFRHTERSVIDEIGTAAKYGIKSVILFGVSNHKDAEGSDAWSEQGLVARMVASVKQAFPNLNVLVDLCFCEYTDHGHCGVLDRTGQVDNDATLINLGKQAVAAALSGADIIAPSGMMDGMVVAIRDALDKASFTHIPVISYSSKFASGLYGPFREASGVTLRGDRKGYQADPANGRAALLESILDESEGADALMVKPAMLYLDILARLRERTLLPIGAYQVGGEYAMIRFAAQHGAIDEAQLVKESMLSIKRAGADYILTYFAKDVANFLAQGTL